MALNTTNVSSLNESTSQLPVDDMIIPQDQLNLVDIFEIFCNDIRKLCDDIKRQYRSKQCSATPAAAAEKTVVLQEMSTLLENKTMIVNKLAAHVKELKYDDFPHFKGDATVSILCMMEEEVDCCQKGVALLEKMKDEYLKELEVLNECEKISGEMSETEVISQTMESSLLQTDAEITKEFKQAKKDMRMVVDLLYPDSNCMEILGELVEKSGEDDSEWFEISDTSQFPFILLLSSLNLVRINEDNKKLIRLNI